MAGSFKNLSLENEAHVMFYVFQVEESTGTDQDPTRTGQHTGVASGQGSQDY